MIAALLAVLPLPAVVAQPDRPSAEGARAPQPRGADATDPAEVRIDAVQVRGSLSLSVVRRAIERIRPMLSQCYRLHAAALAFDTPTVRVNATIDEVGRVRSSNVEGDAPPALNACLVKATTKIVTEAPDTGVVRASWKLRF